jgi:uncharacterized protein
MKRRAVLLGGLALGACASPQPRLYSLAPTASPSDLAGFPLSVGLEPVDVAAVASRREIVLRPSRTEVTLMPLDLWAEPLDEMLQRVLAEEMSRRLGAAEVVRLPSRVPRRPERLVDVRIVDFDGRAGGIARLTAIWTIFSGQPPRPLRSGRTEVDRTYAPPDDASALVTALNEAVAELAADLAEALRASV